MRWILSHRADPRAVRLADKHYNRQKPGTPQFVPPGRCIVLLTEDADALWVSSWPFAEYTRHAWAGAWMNSCFRNESGHLSSELIREAEAATRWVWGDPPALGFVTFVDASKTRHKRDPGRCYRKAGWTHVGFTQGGLHALQRQPNDAPQPIAPLGATLELVLRPAVRCRKRGRVNAGQASMRVKTAIMLALAKHPELAVCPHGETLGAWCVECPGEVAQAGHKTGAVA